MNEGRDIIRVGSMFSGIGGIELGLHRANESFKPVWFVEKEPFCQAILRKHWPDTPIHDDVTTVDFGSLQGVDVLTGGFPCQDISNAGAGVGIEGERSGLWEYLCEATRVLRPRILFVENVSALIGRGLDRVLLDLTKIGYAAEWYSFGAGTVGAPHQRDRIAIIAYPDDDGHVAGEELRGDEASGDSGRSEEQESSWELAGAGESVNGVGIQGGSCGGEQRQGVVGRGRGAEEVVCHSDGERLEADPVDGVLREQALEEGDSGQHSSAGGEDVRLWYGEMPPLTEGCGVDDGLPNRTHRIKALGNAVVPAWAEAVGRAIYEVEFKEEVTGGLD